MENNQLLGKTIELKTIEPNIEGYAVECGENGIYVPLLFSKKENEGNINRLIVKLKLQYPLIKFPNVLSPKLQIMLIRQGFKLTTEYSSEYEENIEVWVWENNMGKIYKCDNEIIQELYEACKLALTNLYHNPMRDSEDKKLADEAVLKIHNAIAKVEDRYR